MAVSVVRGKDNMRNIILYIAAFVLFIGVLYVAISNDNAYLVILRGFAFIAISSALVIVDGFINTDDK